MARPTPFVKPVLDAPPPRRFFTPLNVLLLILALGGAATAAVIQFAADAPKPRVEVAPANAAASTPTTTPATPPPPVRTGISQPPGGLSTALAGPITTTQPEGITHGSALELFKTTPPTLGLDPPLPGTAVPVNKIDLFTGKGCGPAAVYKTYKGYTVGFCCNQSGGHISGWDSMNEAEKDTFVRSFIPK